ncbi:WYL domain-containing protein [Sulfurimonas sp. HSL3-7]|uniref:helix-turn-helix transcriptional regulator n=1 Tax=Sulfonitrofixus jiaomeiensis TaxID=3131938 RepID=UPI0031F7EF05
MDHEYDKILTRLTRTLSRLNSGEALSVKELADEYNVSTKTIQRDFNEKLCSFPIYQEKKKWKMQKGFRVEKTKTVQEQLVLDIMEKMAEDIGGNFYTTAHSLLSKIKNEEFNPIYTKLNIEDISDKFNEIQKLEQAINNKQIITCIYDDEKEPPRRECLKPLKIVNYEGFWYLVALDEDEYVRKLYLKKVSNVIVTRDSFSPSTKIETLLENSINIWFQSDREPFDVTIYADAKVAKYFNRKPLSTQRIISTHSDGSLEFVVTITYEMEIIPIIQYWLPHLRIIEPLWIDDIIKQELKLYIKGNNDD